MADWQLHVAYTDLDQSPAEALAANADAKLEGEDRTVAGHLLLDASIDGDIATMGDLVDRIANLDDVGRRRLLDRTREAAGLESATDVEAHERFLAANEMARRRAAQRPTPACASCGRPPTSAGGMPTEAPRVRKWFCADCEHLAAPGDLDPPSSNIRPNFSEVPDPAEVEREQLADERRHEAARERAAERAVEAAERRAAGAAWDEAWRPSGPGWTS